MTPHDSGSHNEESAPDNLEALVAQIRDLSRQTRELAERPGVGSELVVAASSGPDAIKAEIAARRSAINRASTQLQRLRDELQQRVRNEMALVEDALRPMRKAVERMEELVWTVNLYLGRDEEFVALLDGEPAPPHTAISIRQMVLSMDEETTIAAESGGIDFRDLDMFDRWVSRPENLRRVLPEPRGVVVLVPRRRGRDYGEPILNSVLNNENQRSYWLIRNGGRLVRMSTDFEVGDLLTPARNEFEKYFTEPRFDSRTGTTQRVPLEPGSGGWLRAEERADARRRHYMRAALILQGLVDRTTVFHPMPAERVNLLDPASYEAGHVQLICDAEPALTTGRQPFYQWLAERNQQLRPGMRIVGAFTSEAFTCMRSRERWNYGQHDRLWPQRAEAPRAGTPYRIDDRTPDGGFVFRYARTEEVPARAPWGSLEFRTPKTRASCTVYPSDRFILPIDLVTVEELRDYLEARSERHAYTDLLPLIKSAIVAKEAEADAERPFRDLLIGQIVAVHRADIEEATDAVDDLISWWKHTHMHYRPLTPGGGRRQAQAVRDILTEFAARRAAAALASQERSRDDATVEHLRDMVPDAMVIARARDGGYIVLAPHQRLHPAPLARDNVWVREYTTGKTARTLRERSWVLPSRARVAKWIVLWQNEKWRNWNLTASRADNLTDPEIDEILARLRTIAGTHTHSVYNPTSRRWTQRATGEPAAIACTNGDGRPDLRVYFAADTEYVTPARLLSERICDVSMPAITVSWRRSTGNSVQVALSNSPTSKVWQAHGPHGDNDVMPPWTRETLLWQNDEVVTRTRREAERNRRDRQQASRLRETVTNTVRVVADAWTARAENAARQRFLDDYRDPDLWEGYRKTIAAQLAFPHHNASGRGLVHLLQRLVEDGHDLTGHTVASAAKVLGEPVGLPEDIMDLPLTSCDTPGTSS